MIRRATTAPGSPAPSVTTEVRRGARRTPARRPTRPPPNSKAWPRSPRRQPRAAATAATTNTMTSTTVTSVDAEPGLERAEGKTEDDQSGQSEHDPRDAFLLAGEPVRCDQHGHREESAVHVVEPRRAIRSR